ncbi:MAG TPA: ABC transporter ATP-binding protein [Bryobacteraceae bacterium]|jgi:ATP-binding cassette subfamily B protein|nr:ABC transporter ATP-binding protein [Bryobacteraceae bacterium]
MSSSTILSEAPATTKYTLSPSNRPQKRSLREAGKKFLPLFATEKKSFYGAVGAIVYSSLATLVAPILIVRAIDVDIRGKNMHGLLISALIVLAIYISGSVASYIQVITMGSVGRRALYHMRNALFLKLQDLPVAFFNQNKAGDLISRLNNDTDKLNQFVAQSFMQFVGSVFLITGAGIFVLSLNLKLGIAALLPALGVALLTRGTSGWIKRMNLGSLQALGGMSSEVQENLNNFKVIVAFNRVDYFRWKFNSANEKNYAASTKAGFANNIFMPLYGLASQMAQLLVVAYGIWLIQRGQVTVGLLIGFLLYVNNFYGPMRQLAAVWASFQMAMAALDRISEVMSLESNLPVITAAAAGSRSVISFRQVSFRYPDGKEVLRDISFEMERGKAYALVGPTGGGKTTTANLMARLYDATRGSVLLDGRDIRSYTPEERARKIGFILQDPFLFSGTVRDNILYGNEAYRDYSSAQLGEVLNEASLGTLVSRFPDGLDTAVTTAGNSISLGQKQLIAFMRAVLRKPELLILDEATANIDTVTEELLQEILNKLPSSTTRVIIAHRLNTISNVDQIYFVNSGEITLAGSMEHAVDMLMHEKRAS